MTDSFAHDTPALAQTYDRVSDRQPGSGKRLVERLGATAGARVLDIGCGTGCCFSRPAPRDRYCFSQ